MQVRLTTTWVQMTSRHLKQAHQTLVQQRQQMSSRCISTPGPPLPPIPKSLCGLHIDLRSRQVLDPSMCLAGIIL